MRRVANRTAFGGSQCWVAVAIVAACQAGPVTPSTPAGTGAPAAPRDATPARDLTALYGKTAASPGALFAGIELGLPGRDPRATPRAIEDYASANHMKIALALDAITIELAGGCADLGHQLATTWGAAPNVWLDPATHRRARLDPKACTLRFDRYADVAAFIDQTLTAVVPLAVIGTPAKQLRDRLGPRLESDEAEGTQDRDPRLHVNENALLGELSWQDVGVGPGVDDGQSPRTSITAYTKRGKIVGLVVSASVDRVTGEAIRDRITALLKTTPADDLDEGMLVWKSPPTVHLDFECKRIAERTPLDCFHLEVGTQRASFAH